MASVAAGMAERGWVPGMLQDPPGLHMMMSLLHENARPQYLLDLASSAHGAKPAGGQVVRAVY